MTEMRFDVVVLGGGLVGSALAATLAGQGLAVALVDPVAPEIHSDPAFDGRAYAVAEGSANLLTAIGVWEHVAGEAEPVQRIEVADRTPGPVGQATLAFDPAEVARAELGWILEDRWLRGALLRAVADAGVTHLAPARAEAVERTPTHAEVSLDGGTTLGASLVVACDGRRSAVARSAGIRYFDRGYDQIGLVAAIAHDLPHDGVAHQAFFPGGPFAVLPLPGGRSSIVWSERAGPAREIAALDDAAYTRALAARIGGRLGAIRLEGQRRAYPLGLQLAMDYARPRLVVAGDAAHGVHPIAGQGLNMGLRDAAALAQVLVEARRRGEDLGAIDVLRRYEIWRRWDASTMALGMDGLNRMFSTDRAPLQALRNLGLGAVAHLGAARRFFMRTAAGQQGEVPRLLAGRPI